MTKPLKTREQVLEEFKRKGISIGSWAKANNFNRLAVYRLLSGKGKATYGASHQIAVALGLKEGEIADVAEHYPNPMREAA